MRPIEASPRSKMFTTQPSAIIGQCSMVEVGAEGHELAEGDGPATTMRPPSHSTSTAPVPIRSWMPG